MNFKIRKIKNNDKEEILSMMREFYSSEAVFTNGSDEIFENDFNNCINGCPYLEGCVFEQNNEILGYSMIAKSFSTEFGKICIWLEDLYIKPKYRGLKIGSKFLDYIENLFPNAIIRLELEKENTCALGLYKKQGFMLLPYIEMVKKG